MSAKQFRATMFTPEEKAKREADGRAWSREVMEEGHAANQNGYLLLESIKKEERDKIQSILSREDAEEFASQRVINVPE